jgi:hypothetical protein
MGNTCSTHGEKGIVYRILFVKSQSGRSQKEDPDIVDVKLS